MRRRVRVTLIAAAFLFAALLAVVLPQSSERVAASNTRVIASENVVGVPAGATRCTPGENVPADGTRLRLYPGVRGSAGGPPLAITVRERDGRVVRSTAVRGGYASGPLVVDFPGAGRALAYATTCIRNRGSEDVVFGGNYDPVSPEAPPAAGGPDKQPRDYVRMDWLRPGRESWIALAPRMAERFPLLKAGFAGAWTFWFVIVAIVAVAVGAVATVLREVRRA